MYIGKLKELTRQDMIEIRRKINCYEWDERLGEKPDGWDDMPDFVLSKQHKIPAKTDIVRPIMKEIEKSISEKQLMKYWHIAELGSTKLQYELWWAKRKIMKTLKIGNYSKKNETLMKNILEDIMLSNNKEWMSKTYSPQKE